MGLRTASPRRSRMVMAPALTETSSTQSQNFKLAPKTTPFQAASPISAFVEPRDEKNAKCYDSPEEGAKGEAAEIVFFARAAEKGMNAASDGAIRANNNMNASPLSMGERSDEKMGAESALSTQKEKNIVNDVEQLLDNFGAGDCTASDIPANVDDILQVFRSIESGSERLNDEDFSINGADLANNLLSFEKQLLNDVDMMNMSIEDQAESLKETRTNEMIVESKKKQVQVQRRLDFMKRRVYKLQARLMGQHVSGEVAGVFEHVHRSLKRLKDNSINDKTLDAPIMPSSLTNDERPKPMSYGSVKALVRKLEMSSALQANSAARQRHVPKYFGSGSIEPATFRTSVAGIVAIPPWPTEQKAELQKVSGLLGAQLRLVQSEVDSEATDSSSGGESCDEFQNYNNQHQQYLSIQKRALWKYTTDRAAIASRWTWLQVQISDLEYRIRQHTELQRQVRAAKTPVTLAGADPRVPIDDDSDDGAATPAALNGYRGPLIGHQDGDRSGDGCGGSVDEWQCCRTRPLANFRKRKLLQTNGLHVVSKKAARPSSVRCGCAPPTTACAICTGRSDPTHPRDPIETMSKAERIAMLDPCYHPVFSMADDVSEGIHLEAVMKMPEWQQRTVRMKGLKAGYAKGDRLDKSLDHRSQKHEHRRKYTRSIKPSTMSALSANGLDEEVESISNNAATGSSSGGPASHNASRSSVNTPSSSPLLHMQSISGGYNKRNRVNSYDIDNIVIPYSVAAATRVEKLQYKEILTPKWRIADFDFPVSSIDKNNGAVTTTDTSQEVCEPEDLTDEAVIQRHDKCEYDERKKFLSYLKLPVGYGRARSHKRTDSRAESSGANTPDPLSPHPIENTEPTTAPTTTTTPLTGSSPVTSPPSTPLYVHGEELSSMPSISMMRRRTISQTRPKDENSCGAQEHVETAPFDRRSFPLDEETYDKMLKHMPEDHQFKTNVLSQDNFDFPDSEGYMDRKVGSPGSESTESAMAEEDPNDPEWIEVERTRDRHRR